MGFWQRTGACFLDSFLLYLIMFGLLLAIFGMSGMDGSPGPWEVVLLVVAYMLPPFLILMFWIKKSRTPGKMAIGATIVDARTGARPSTKQFIIRYLAYGLSTIPCFLGYFWIAFDARKQGWHDKLADTVVIRRKAGSAQPVSFEHSAKDTMA